MRHCHAIVGTIPTIARRISRVPSRNDPARKAVMLRIPVGRVAVVV
jgi:hypothetical protein